MTVLCLPQIWCSSIHPALRSSAWKSPPPRLMKIWRKNLAKHQWLSRALPKCLVIWRGDALWDLKAAELLNLTSGQTKIADSIEYFAELKFEFGPHWALSSSDFETKQHICTGVHRWLYYILTKFGIVPFSGVHACRRSSAWNFPAPLKNRQ